MKSKFYLCVLMWIALLPVSYGQHTITSSSDVISGNQFRETYKTAAVNNHVYVAEPNVNYLRNYSGFSVSHHSYPVVSGIQTDIYGYWITRPLETFESNLYMTLYNTAGHYLYRFNGTSFVSIPTPFPVVSNPVVHNGKLYVIGRSANAMKLIAYNGTTVTTVFTYPVPSTSISFQLISAGKYLYMLYNKDDIEVKQIVRYNGVSALALPLMSALEIKDIIAMPGTQNIIIDQDHFHPLKHFDGTTLTTLSGIDSDGTLTSILPYHGDFYIQYNYEETMSRALYRYHAGVTTYIPLPPGVQPEYLGESTVYHDEIYMPVVLPDFSRGVYRYDGTTFSPFFNFPGLVGEALSTWAFVGKRNGNLLIVPDTRGGETAYEYNGTSFSWIHTDAGEKITKFIGNAGCFYGWLTEVETSSLGVGTYRLAKEYGPSCSPVFPVRFGEFEHVDISAYAPGRDWCWTGIDIDWTLEPCLMVPPFCPGPPAFQVTMFESPGNVAYQNDFSQPFSAAFPLVDNDNYRLTVGMNEGSIFDNVLMLNKALVPKGFESISMRITPKQREFKLTVTTDNNINIPFVLSLLGDNGQVIWEVNLTAPLTNALITGTADRPGSALRIVPAPQALTSLQDYGIKTITNYPNPTSGRITIDIKSDGDLEVPVIATLTDMMGNKLISRSYKESGSQQFDATGQKPGLYILSVSAGNASQKEMIQIK